MPITQGRIPNRNRVEELERMYGAMEKEITKELLSTDVGNYQEVRVVRAQEKINRLIKRLNREAIRWSKVAVPETYEEGYDVSRTRLEILGAQRDEEFNDKTHKQTVDFEIDEMMDTLIKANQSIKMNVGMYFYLVRQVAQGLMQIQEFDFRDEEFISGLLDDAIQAGESRGYAKKLIMTHIKSEVGEGKFIQIRGRNYNMRSYADMVAKTRLRHVQTEAVRKSCKEFKNDLVEVSDHGTECLICIPYEGNVYSISGKHPVYPLIPAWTPFHPRCQHHVRPTSDVALGTRGRDEPISVRREEIIGPSRANFYKNVTDKEIDVIQAWSDDKYTLIRKYLRAGEIERENLIMRFGNKLKEDAGIMEKLFLKYKDGVSDKMLYRGLSDLPDDIYDTFKKYKTGEVAELDKTIASWTTDAETMEKFSGGKNQIKLHLEGGRTKTLELDIKDFSGMEFEKEVILSSHKFKITAIEEEIIPSIIPGSTAAPTRILNVFLKEAGK